MASTTQFSEKDLKEIKQCRHGYTQLGFGYQLAFVRTFNRFPAQEPLYIVDEIITFVSLQLRIDPHNIQRYDRRRKTVSEHQDIIRRYLTLRFFSSVSLEVEDFLFKESYSLEQTSSFMARLRDFLKQNQILEPSQDTMLRMIQTQREAARAAIYDKVSGLLCGKMQQSLDAMISTEADNATYSPLYFLKPPPGNPSPASFIKLTETLERIKDAGILSVDLAWLNNNFQRSLARYAHQCTIYRLRRLKEERRYTVLTCFLQQLYQDTFDAAVQMHDKLMNKVYNKADKDIDRFMKARRKQLRVSLIHYRDILGVLLNEDIKQEDIKNAIFQTVDEETLKIEMADIDDVLSDQYSDSFKRVIARFSYIRQFSPALLKHITFQVDTQDKTSENLIEAINLLNRMNTEGKHKLPEDAPIDFIPKKRQPFVFQEDKLHKPAWECALLTVLRDQIKSGHLSVSGSKRFASLETFFILETDWASRRKAFFSRANLPSNSEEVPAYLTNRLNKVYDQFLERQPNNHYAKLDEKGWQIASDPTEKLDYGTDTRLNPLKDWIGKHLQTIKLPDLLIEVDNELHFSRSFMSAADQDHPEAQQVCEIMATVMAHASEVGPFTMSQIVEGVSYDRMKHITDWHLHEEAQRSALAKVVNAISQLDITKAWGDGTTSSSDGQRFSLYRKVLQKSYSHAFNDFALEFYHFVANNDAPYFSLTHECADRDAPFVLDGILYNESDLNIEEH